MSIVSTVYQFLTCRDTGRALKSAEQIIYCRWMRVEYYNEDVCPHTYLWNYVPELY